MKTCTICDTEFDRSATGRLRILRKEPRGEAVVWICPACADRVEFAV